MFNSKIAKLKADNEKLIDVAESLLEQLDIIKGDAAAQILNLIQCRLLRKDLAPEDLDDFLLALSSLAINIFTASTYTTDDIVEKYDIVADLASIAHSLGVNSSYDCVKEFEALLKDVQDTT